VTRENTKNPLDQQYAFVESQLKASTHSVGIDLDVSREALIALALFSDIPDSTLEDLCGSEDVFMVATQLLSKFRSKAGSRLLKNLGIACMMASRDTYVPRSWEPESITSEWAETAMEHRILCDFAMYTAIAASDCANFLDPDKPASLGGRARAASYDLRKHRIISICDAEFPNWRSTSAEKIAGEIYGRAGIDLSHRKIAEIIRKAKK